MKIIGTYGNDNATFEKNDEIQYANAESKVDYHLVKKFDTNFPFTIRSHNSINNLLNAFMEIS